MKSNRFLELRYILAGIGLLVVSLAALLGYLLWRAQPPDVVPAAECAVLPETIEPTVPWRFITDTRDVGLTGRWFEVDFDDRNWVASAPGEEWKPEYLGVAWYRATFSIPAEWEAAYLGIGRLDDTARLWVNGGEVDWDPPTGDESQVIPLEAGRPQQVTLRVVNAGGPGGIKQPVRVGRLPHDTLAPESFVRWSAVQRPDWPMPGWARNDYFAWTFTGQSGVESKALFGADGSVAPWPTAPNVSLWLYQPPAPGGQRSAEGPLQDGSAGTLSAPRPVFSLLDGYLPIPTAEWRGQGLSVRTTLFRADDGSGTSWQAVLTNETDSPASAVLLAVVRPLSFNPGVRPTYAAGFDRIGRLWLDGRPFLQFSPAPAKPGVGTLAEVLEAARTGSVPDSNNLPCAPDGDAAAATAYAIQLEPRGVFRLSLDFPSEPGAPFPGSLAGDSLDVTRQDWQSKIGNPSVVIPDRKVMDAYRASLGYLLLALTPDGPRPGPLEHAKVWVRDASFIGEALLSAGKGDRVLQFLPRIFEHQAADGRIPPIIGPQGPEPVEEWDSQGQAIFLIAEIYRYNRDRSFLERWEPNVRKAAEFIRVLRSKTQGDPPTTRGLLPPSKSAEDLGPETWHHYWDDFWAVAGLEEAAFIENELGRAGEAGWMRAEADALRRSIRASVETVMGVNPAYIPGSPEDLTSSAMARGTSVSLYPVEVFPPEDPLIKRSFDEYYTKWIAPNKGGYSHLWGQFWPYGGMGLARDYLRLDRQDIVHQILGWSLDHQTLPGTFAWAEQVRPEHGGISGGDMPHAWAAATYVTLLREMLVMRRGQTVELFAGVPSSWLDSGKTVGVKSAPTEFGALTALIESSLDTSGNKWLGSLTLTISASAPPTEGFIWKLPRVPSSFEGPPGIELRDGKLIVPGSGGIVRLNY